MNETKSIFKRREKFIIIIPVIVAVIGVILIFILSNGQSQYTFKESGYQTFCGARTEIPEKTEVTLSVDGEKFLASSDGRDVNLTDLPVYLDDTKGVLIPMYSMVYQPRSEVYGSLQNFGIVYTEDLNTIVKQNAKKKSIVGGFIYDGKDTYIFLEDMEVSFNNHIISVSKYSYCYAVYGNIVILYDYGTDQFYKEEPKTSLIANPTNKDYSISMLDDILTNIDGRKELLFGNPKKINSIFKVK